MTNAEKEIMAERVIKIEQLIYELEPEYNKFIEDNNLSNEFHNVVMWLDSKGVLQID